MPQRSLGGRREGEEAKGSAHPRAQVQASSGNEAGRLKGREAESISKARAKRARSAWEEERGEKEGGREERERRKTSRGGAKGLVAGLLAERDPPVQLQRQLPASRGLRASFVAGERAHCSQT